MRINFIQLFGFLVLIPLFNFAQVTEKTYPVKIIHSTYNNNQFETNIWNAQTYKGSPFLNPEFIEGQIIDSYGSVQKHKLRFNLYNNEVEMLTDDKHIFNLQKQSTIEMVIIGKDTLVFDFCKENKRLTRKYFILSYSGKIKIYDLPLVYGTVEQTELYGKRVNTPVFVDGGSKYFIKKGSREARLVKNNKAFLKICSDKRIEMEQFIRNHKLNASRKDDLIKMASFYDDLSKN